MGLPYINFGGGGHNSVHNSAQSKNSYEKTLIKEERLRMSSQKKKMGPRMVKFEEGTPCSEITF